MPRRPRLSDEERALFREFVAGTRPLPPGEPPPTQKRRPKPIPRQTLDDERAVVKELADALPDLDTETGDEVAWRTPGVQDSVLRKLRRGHFRIDRNLDLHGHTSATAKVEVADFLRSAREEGMTCVRIVHGKGHGSREGRAVLKHRVANWLMHHAGVLAFVSARPAEGGTGAVLVLLRK
ncbi:MAG: Smr/MutS family protein [Xanthomonadaceae bacterium]|nr:Smr/MutS family protein [Xanthomonadaceae bacterium]